MQSISIVIRTLNEARYLPRLLTRFARQEYSEPVEVIVVDNESTDATLRISEQYAARIVEIKRDDFSYPKALNLGVATARHELIVSVSAHAYPITRGWLYSGARHFANRKVAGVYSPLLPGPTASMAEWGMCLPGYLYARLRGVHSVAQSGMGVFGATNCMFRRSVWEEHPFDERYGAGGEDGAWASWALRQGHRIICDYRFTVRHSHGLNHRQLKQQVAYWSKLGEPHPFDRQELAKFRKDLPR